MEIRELTIEIPDGKIVDWDESKKQNKIVLKDNKPRSWEEYCKQQVAKNEYGYQINESNCSIGGILWGVCSVPDKWKNVLPSKELAKAFLAMMSLVSLRQSWVGDWKPEWNDSSVKWCTVSKEDEITIDYFYSDSHPLSFPSREIAEDFMNCFKDLLEIAKPLI